MAAAAEPSTLQYPDKFHAAVEFVNTKPEGSKKLSDETSLVLHALQQQATVGPAGPRPRSWGFGSLETTKWQAHSQLGDMASVEAMRLYVKVLEDEQADWAPLLGKAWQQKASQQEASAGNAEATTALNVSAAPPLPSGGAPSLEPGWEAVITNGAPRPAPRYEHAVAIVCGHFYVVGGNYGGRYLNDVWSLNLQTFLWTCLQTRDKLRGGIIPSEPLGEDELEAKPPENAASAPAIPIFPPCAGHRIVVWGRSLLCIGGHHKVKKKDADMSLRSLDTGVNMWSEVQTSGDHPPARGGHTATLIGNSVYVFGGEDVSRRPHGDLYVLDLPDLSWKKVEAGGTPPAPRSAHVATEFNKRYLLIFGGGSVAHCYNDLYLLDTETMQWSQPKTEGNPPSPRAGHAGAVYKGSWYIVGGGNNTNGCSDTVALDLEPLTRGEPLVWRPVGTFPPRSPLASEGLSLIVAPSLSGLLAFGGYNGRYHADVNLFRPVAPEEEAGPAGSAAAAGAGAGAGAGPSGAPPARSTAKAEASVAPQQSSKEQAPANGALRAPPTGGAVAAEVKEAQQEVEAARREAEAMKEAAAAELALMRHQLATAQAATQEAERKLEAAQKEITSKDTKIFGLEIEIAELSKKLDSVSELEKELQHYRALASEAEASKSKGGLWGLFGAPKE